jgi:hypothetical protein
MSENTLIYFVQDFALNLFFGFSLEPQIQFTILILLRIV